jgi:hypothetical protein
MTKQEIVDLLNKSTNENYHYRLEKGYVVNYVIVPGKPEIQKFFNEDEKKYLDELCAQYDTEWDSRQDRHTYLKISYLKDVIIMNYSDYNGNYSKTEYIHNDEHLQRHMESIK